VVQDQCPHSNSFPVETEAPKIILMNVFDFEKTSKAIKTFEV
jgi:hypothetical protein